MKTKKLHLEALRIIAIFLVILTHTGIRGFTYFTTLSPSPRYFLAMLLPLTCQICVPLFYMISGATLLDRDEPLTQLWRRRISRIGAVLVLAVLMMYLYYDPVSLGGYLKTLFSRNVIVPYWYLYSYLGFLIGLPFLRRMIRSMTETEFRYLFGLRLVLGGLVPMLAYRLSEGTLRLNPSLDLVLVTSDIVVFPAAGYYFERRQLGARQLAGLWIAAILATLAAVYMTHYKILLTGQLGEGQVGTFYKTLCLIPTVTVYATVRWVFSRWTVPGWLETGIVTLGSCTFGIYLIEQIPRERGWRLRDLLIRWLPDIPAILLYVTLVLAVCFVIVFLAKKLPGVKKLI